MIGSGGAGKTTFARALAERTGLPLIHLDALYWKPGWEPAPNEAWDRTVAELMSRDTWIMDGNYGRTLPRRLAECDAVFFLDLPRYVCLWRLLRRRLRHHSLPRPDISPGCPERLTWDFVWWVWTYPRRRRPDIVRQLQALPPHVRVEVLRSSEEVRRYLAGLERQGGPAVPGVSQQAESTG